MVNPTHVRLAAVAKQQIDKNGRIIVLSKVTVSQDRQTGTTAPSTVQQTIKGVEVNYNESQVNGTTVQAGDKQFLIASDDLQQEIDNSWKVLDGSEIWNVQNKSPIRPGDTSILVKIQVRR